MLPLTGARDDGRRLHGDEYVLRRMPPARRHAIAKERLHLKGLEHTTHYARPPVGRAAPDGPSRASGKQLPGPLRGVQRPMPGSGRIELAILISSSWLMTGLLRAT